MERIAKGSIEKSPPSEGFLLYPFLWTLPCHGNPFCAVVVASSMFMPKEVTDFIRFAPPLLFFCRFQPKNRMSSPETT